MKKVHLIFLVLMAFSCLNEPDCLHDDTAALTVGFKKLSDGKPDEVFIYKIVADGADSVFYLQKPVDELDKMSSALIRVNPYANETLFTFYFATGEKTLKVGYQVQAQFISEDCGTQQTYHALEILETQFDSVRVVNSRLSKSGGTNIEIIN